MCSSSSQASTVPSNNVKGKKQKENSLNNLVLDHDPSVINLGCDDNNYAMDATEKVQRKSILRGHSGPVYDVSYTAQGRYLMSVSEDTTMRLWDLKSGVNKAIYHGHSYPIWSVDADRVGFNLVTGQF